MPHSSQDWSQTGPRRMSFGVSFLHVFVANMTGEGWGHEEAGVHVLKHACMYCTTLYA